MPRLPRSLMFSASVTSPIVRPMSSVSIVSPVSLPSSLMLRRRMGISSSDRMAKRLSPSGYSTDKKTSEIPRSGSTGFSPSSTCPLKRISPVPGLTTLKLIFSAKTQTAKIANKTIEMRLIVTPFVLIYHKLTKNEPKANRKKGAMPPLIPVSFV